MKPTDFLIFQLICTLPLLFWARNKLANQASRVIRLVIFIAVISFSIDYIANDRLIWTFFPGWKSEIIINPLENTLFAVVMTLHLLLLYLALGSRTAKRSH